MEKGAGYPAPSFLKGKDDKDGEKRLWNCNKTGKKDGLYL